MRSPAIAAGNGVNLVGQNCDTVSGVCFPSELNITDKLAVGAVDGSDVKTGFSHFGSGTVHTATSVTGVTGHDPLPRVNVSGAVNGLMGP